MFPGASLPPHLCLRRLPAQLELEAHRGFSMLCHSKVTFTDLLSSRFSLRNAMDPG
jgi:hypothetical protein